MSELLRLTGRIFTKIPSVEGRLGDSLETSTYAVFRLDNKIGRSNVFKTDRQDYYYLILIGEFILKLQARVIHIHDTHTSAYTVLNLKIR